MKNSPAHKGNLLVFTIGAGQEVRRRKLLPVSLNQIERAFHQQCLESTLAAGRTSHCRLFVASPTPLPLGRDVEHLSQLGSTFGERLRQAHTEGLERCGGPLIVVGSDIPDLTAGHLTAALDSLEADPSRVVLGPSPDGGFYLLATIDPIPREIWSRVRWRSRKALASLIQALQDAGRSVALLSPLTDLDHRADLHSWLARVATVSRVRGRRGSVSLERPWSLLLQRLRRLLLALCQISIPQQLGTPLAATIPRRAGRAPPPRFSFSR